MFIHEKITPKKGIFEKLLAHTKDRQIKDSRENFFQKFFRTFHFEFTRMYLQRVNVLRFSELCCGEMSLTLSRGGSSRKILFCSWILRTHDASSMWANRISFSKWHTLVITWCKGPTASDGLVKVGEQFSSPRKVNALTSYALAFHLPIPSLYNYLCDYSIAEEFIRAAEFVGEFFFVFER